MSNKEPKKSILSLSNEQRNAAYDHKRNWKSTAQPFLSKNVSDYHMISEAAAPNLMEQAREFCKDNDFTYLEISHDQFRDFERSPKNFRDWIDDLCQQKNEQAVDIAKINKIEPELYDSRADFAIIGPRIKTEKSAARKVADGTTQADRVVDYLGIQFVALKQKNGRKNKKSLETQEKAMKAIEESPKTRAIKNLYWNPHDKTKFRAHYSLWEASVPESNHLLLENGASTIIAEVKMEHESQMDIDKLTRTFINIGRDVERIQTTMKYSKPSNNNYTEDHKRNFKLSLHEQEKQVAIDALSGLLYNRVFKDAGFDRFIDPKIKSNFSALPTKALLSATTETIKEHCTSGQYRSLVATVKAMDMFQSRSTPTKGSSRKKSPT